MGQPTHPPQSPYIFEPPPPLPAEDLAAKTILRLAKFIDITVTKDDELLSELEWQFGQSLTRLSHAAERILHRAETKTWGGGA